MSTDEIRTRVVRCIRDYYAAHGEAPSIRQILDDAHMNRRQLYDAFPGIAAACRLAGVPVPDARIQQTGLANRAVRNRRITTPRRVETVAGDPHVHEQVRVPRRLLDQLEAARRQERAALRDSLDEFREDNDALRDALSPFLDVFGDGFFDSEGYDVMQKFHAFMVSWGYRGSLVNMLLDSVELAMASKEVCYRNGAIRAIGEDPATPRLVWRA